MIVGILFDNKFFSLLAITGFDGWKLKLDKSYINFLRAGKLTAAMFRNFSRFPFTGTLASRLAGGVDSEGLENKCLFTRAYWT